MFVIAACVAALCAGAPALPQDTAAHVAGDTTRRTAPRPVPADTLPARPPARAPADSMPSRMREIPDTMRAYIDTRLIPGAVASRPRKKAVVQVEYSDWYNRRLTVHRWASYATLPLFAANYMTGRELFEHGNQAPPWAIRAHGPLATSVTSLFAVNSLTGGWNLLDGRNDPNGRKWRVTHALLMLGADAGFATAGILASQAERSDQRRHLHRTIALSSIGVSFVSYAMMLPPFRRD